ncbi:hypothetical protein [Halomicrococcus sp. SG-WS-1]|uniref:hypothetical protein n=1 Tax=Halomicrococcus sp. SG-WS-1 TaxID=3439057 RepID=UPI003F7B3090
MSQATQIPAWAASPEKFEDTLSALVATADESDLEFDRSWTFRYDDSDRDDVMVEISRLASRPNLTDQDPVRPPSLPEMPSTKEFETALDELLLKGQEAGIDFDRAWTLRNPDPDRDDVMVEISRLAKPA